VILFPRQVWSGWLKRALEAALADVVAGTVLNKSSVDGTGQARKSGRDGGSAKLRNDEDGSIFGALKGAALGGTLSAGRTVRRIPGSSVASLVNDAKMSVASASSTDAATTWAPPTSSGGRARSLGDAGFEGQAVHVATHGVNGAAVCAFARHAQIQVAKWLTDAHADGATREF